MEHGIWDNLIFISIFKAGSHYTALASQELRDMSGCVSQVCVPPTMAQNKLSPIHLRWELCFEFTPVCSSPNVCTYLGKQGGQITKGDGLDTDSLPLNPASPDIPPFWDVK